MHESGVLYSRGTAKFRNQLATNYQNARERLPDSRFLIDQELWWQLRALATRNPFFATSVNHRNCNNHLLIKVSTGDDHPIPSKFPHIIFGYE